MHLRVASEGRVEGHTEVPGDKSIAHRWLMLAAIADGTSRLAQVPPSLDLRATAACLASLVPSARPALHAWSAKDTTQADSHGFTWDARVEGSTSEPGRNRLEVEAEGRSGLAAPEGILNCANSGTTMRLLAGIVAGSAFRTVLAGDRSLSTRPMERIAEPLREMGATVATRDGRPPITIRGGGLRGIRFSMPIASAQVKSCILLAGLAAKGRTIVEEPVRTRDHTERALLALGVPIDVEGSSVSVEGSRHEGFDGEVPGDISSAAFLVAAAGLTGGELIIRRVGLNPTRTHYLDVMERMGVMTERVVHEERMGEPVGELTVRAGSELRATTVEAEELPLILDEVPVLAAVAAHTTGETRFRGAGELRLKESDRLATVSEGIRGLGGGVAASGDELVVDGGGLRGGRASSGGDHRVAMALAVAALAASRNSTIGGMEAADVSFPGFAHVLRSLGAKVEVA